MSDAPMTASEFVRKIIHAIKIRSYTEDALVETFTDYTADIRQQAQAEALEQAASLEKNEMEAIRKMGGEHMEVEVLKSKIRLNSILNLSPIPNYRERIEAQAKLEAARIALATVVASGAIPIEDRRSQMLTAFRSYIGDLEADLARLAAADAPKEGK